MGHWFMHKHKLIKVQKIVEEKIGSLTEEVEIGTNMKLNPLYIADPQRRNRISTTDYKNYQTYFKSRSRRKITTRNDQKAIRNDANNRI